MIFRIFSQALTSSFQISLWSSRRLMLWRSWVDNFFLRLLTCKPPRWHICTCLDSVSPASKNQKYSLNMDLQPDKVAVTLSCYLVNMDQILWCLVSSILLNQFLKSYDSSVGKRGSSLVRGKWPVIVHNNFTRIMKYFVMSPVMVDYHLSTHYIQHLFNTIIYLYKVQWFLII